MNIQLPNWNKKLKVCRFKEYKFKNKALKGLELYKDKENN